MKEIIDGKRYNTETADEIVRQKTNGHTCTDFNWCKEGLYRTKLGQWFLAGEGNALSKYRRYVGDGYSNGEKIIPLTSDEAREWLEMKGETEKIEKHFDVDDA